MIGIHNGWFQLRNSKISYVISVMENGQPAESYFGKALHQLDDEDVAYMNLRLQKAAGTVKYATGSSFTLADQTSELPVYGTTNFQSGLIELEDKNGRPLYPDFQIRDAKILQGKSYPLAGPHCRPDRRAETLILTLVDSVHEVEVRLYYTIYPDQAVLVKNMEVTNRSRQRIFLNRALSAVFYLPDDRWDFIHLAGNWARERQVIRQRLYTGGAFCESLYGSSSHQSNPYMAFARPGASEQSGEAYGCNLVYSSNFLNQAEINEFGFVRIMSGIHPQNFRWMLNPEESFQTPEAVIAFSDEGIDGLSREYSRFIRDHIISPKFAYRSRPVCLNSWEAVYYSLNEDNLLELARQGAKAGIDCFVVDDGWFGMRDDSTSSLGDWKEDPKKFPSGLKSLAQKIRDLGLQFGIWFEPEMVNEKSGFYQKHPQRVVRPKKGRHSIGRSQLVLDFSDPQTVEEIYAQMKTVLSQTGASYIKWDMNRDITEPYSEYLEKSGRIQGEFFHRQIHGVYSLYEKIEKDFPDILIEGCAGGGGRFDLGILYYSPQIWVSDNTDGADRLKIQYATSLAYPLSCLSNHISDIPNHQTGRKIPMNFRRDVALFGIFGVELNLKKLPDGELHQIRKQVELYRKMEPLILYGDFYHLCSPFESNEAAWAVATLNEVYLGAYALHSDLAGRTFDMIRTGFLHEGLWHFDGRKIHSDVINQFGIRFPIRNNGTGALNGLSNSPASQKHSAESFSGDYQSAIIHLHRERSWLIGQPESDSEYETKKSN